MGPPLWVNNWRLISWRMRPSTPERVLSRDCWEPLVLNIASMLDAVGGAAKAGEARLDKTTIASSLRRFILVSSQKTQCD